MDGITDFGPLYDHISKSTKQIETSIHNRMDRFEEYVRKDSSDIRDRVKEVETKQKICLDSHTREMVARTNAKWAIIARVVVMIILLAINSILAAAAATYMGGKVCQPSSQSTTSP